MLVTYISAYVLTGLALTVIDCWIERGPARSLPPLALGIVVVLWPLFFGIWIVLGVIASIGITAKILGGGYMDYPAPAKETVA